MKFKKIIVTCIVYILFPSICGCNSNADEILENIKYQERQYNWQIVLFESDILYFYSVNKGVELRIPFNNLKGQTQISEIIDVSLSPDIEKIAAIGYKPLHGDFLCIVDFEDSRYKEIVNRSRITRLSWSPDGERIAYLASSKQYREKTSLYIVNLNNALTTAVVEEVVQPFSRPVWSNDGSVLYYETIDQEIFKIDLNTKQPQKIVDGFASAWSSSRDKLIYRDDEGNFFLFSVKDKTSKPIVFDQNNIFGTAIGNDFVWSPDDHYILFHRAAGLLGYKTAIYVLDLNTLESKKISTGYRRALYWIQK